MINTLLSISTYRYLLTDTSWLIPTDYSLRLILKFDNLWLILADWYSLIDTRWLILADWYELIDTRWLIRTDWYELIDTNWLIRTDWYPLTELWSIRLIEHYVSILTYWYELCPTDSAHTTTNWLIRTDWYELTVTNWLIQTDWYDLITSQWQVSSDCHLLTAKGIEIHRLTLTSNRINK